MILATLVSSIFVTIFACTPAEAAWTYSPDSKCINIVTFYIIATAINATLDLVLCIAPLPFICRIKIPTREKVILCFLFALGFFASAASWVRLSHLHELSTEDISSSVTNTLDWSTIEVGLCIFSASVPSLRPLLGMILPNSQTLQHTRRASAHKTASRTPKANALEVSASTRTHPPYLTM